MNGWRGRRVARDIFVGGVIQGRAEAVWAALDQVDTTELGGKSGRMGEYRKLDEKLTGGCQCAAVRYAVGVQPDNVHVRHCRMCQKAVGGPFAVICPVLKSDFVVTRGEISWFHSSGVARRGFCRDCGTPLIFDYPDYHDIGVLAGSFDQPDRVPPVVQYGVESRVA